MKNAKIKIFAVTIMFVLAGGGVVWFFLSRDTETFKPFELFGGRADESALDQRNNQQNISELTETYTNIKYGFSFRHPKELNFSEFSEDNIDVVLASSGFQILISPFDEPGPITKVRILKDIPDMQISNDKEILIDGVSALSFKSKDESGNETFEIWFARNGYLYQISALPSFEKQIMGILSSWRFSN